MTVVGTGTMGRGIAYACALADHEVTLFDADPAALERATNWVRDTLQTGVEKGKVRPEDAQRAPRRLRTETDLARSVAGCDLLIEAVPEDLDLKRRIFAEADRAAPPGAILASNTSSLGVSLIAAATARPERVVGLHFFNPPHVLRLLEVVRGERTSPAVLAGSLAFARGIGKEPIVVRDAPGFASSRLGVHLGLEAIRMVEEGVATVEDIDRAMELGYNHPMGPLKLTDLVGLDVRLAIAEHLERELGPRFQPPELLRRMVREGKLGRKSGQGFYAYAPKEAKA